MVTLGGQSNSVSWATTIPLLVRTNPKKLWKERRTCDKQLIPKAKSNESNGWKSERHMGRNILIESADVKTVQPLGNSNDIHCIVRNSENMCLAREHVVSIPHERRKSSSKMQL
jgi:hypothetical protein